MKGKVFRTLIGILIILLEVFGQSIVMKGATGPGQYIQWDGVGYLSGLAFGYGNIFPILVFIFSLVLLILSLLSIKNKTKATRSYYIVGAFALVFNLIPVLLGMQVVTRGLILIEVLLILLMLVPIFENEKH